MGVLLGLVRDMRVGVRDWYRRGEVQVCRFTVGWSRALFLLANVSTGPLSLCEA